MLEEFEPPRLQFEARAMQVPAMLGEFLTRLVDELVNESLQAGNAHAPRLTGSRV